MNGLAKDVFTDTKIANYSNPFSRAANLLNRQDVYAAHNNNGKAHLWITISPPDHECRKILFYALQPKQFIPHEDQVPDAALRFKVLADNPVAAALHFERVLNVLIENIIGWDRKKKMPKRSGGLFGIPKAWVRVVEEQGRLTLHTHMLLWLIGHEDLMSRLKVALQSDLIQALFAAFEENVVAITNNEEPPQDDIELENALLCPNDSCSCQRLRACKDEDEDPENIVDLTLAGAPASGGPGSAFSPPSLLANQPARDATDLSERKLSCETCNTMYTFQERLSSLLTRISDTSKSVASLPSCLQSTWKNGPCLNTILERLTANIDLFVTGELTLPQPELDLAHTCQDENCNGILDAIEGDEWKALRQAPTVDAPEPKALKCTTCVLTYTISSCIQRAFKAGFKRVGHAIPDEEERLRMVWKGVGPRPDDSDSKALDI